MSVTKFQKFEICRVDRKDLVMATYNPNVLSQEAKKKIKRKIKDQEVGLLEAIIWNKRTKNIVGGHHRIQIIDELEKNIDYEIDVCVVDLSEKHEKEMNVFLNNKSVQGDYDLSALAEFKLDDNIEFGDMGFSESDVDFMFGGDSDFSALFADSGEVVDSKEAIEKIKDARAQAKEKLEDINNGDFYFTVVCETQEQKKELMKKFNTPIYEKYVNADYVLRAING